MRLFVLLYLVGVGVTAFMSNDATAVVLTPAVYACVKRAKVDPKPYLFACAFIANAASFLLPISNPANLVVYGKSLPSLTVWVQSFGLASLVSIAVTFTVLAFLFRHVLKAKTSQEPSAGCETQLSGTGRITLASIFFFIAVLLTSSALRVDLGFPTLLASLCVVTVIALKKRQIPLAVFKNVSWSVIPLVGGLFIVVDALNRARVLELTKSFFESANSMGGVWGRQLVAFSVGLVANIANNLPVGLTVGQASQVAHLSESVRQALLIGIDLGPNLSVTGSLATILWLICLRREGEHVGFLDFLKIGAVTMPLSLFLTVLCLKSSAT